MQRPVLAIALALAAAGQAAAQPAVEAGRKLYVQCAGCHAIDRGQKNPIGPHLAGVVGRKAGQDKAFAYSPAMKAAAARGVSWTPQTLDRFLASPAAVVPKSTMFYPGLKSPKDRQALVAYLKTRR